MEIPQSEQLKITKWAPFAFACVFVLVIFNIIFLLKFNRISGTPTVDTYLQGEKNKLESKITELQKQSDSLFIQINQRDKIITDLETKKTEIKYVYIHKLKEIDNLNVNGIIAEYKHIFTTKSNN